MTSLRSVFAVFNRTVCHSVGISHMQRFSDTEIPTEQTLSTKH